MTRAADVVVIGAGPAGLAAATAVAEMGLSAVLLDEQPRPGGQIYRGVETAGARRLKLFGEDYAEGRELVARFRASGAGYVPGAAVWNVSSERDVEFSVDGASSQIRARALVAATGALERPFPIPGWTLPGVTTVGALQILLKTAGIVHEDAVLAGSGPLLWLLAAQMVDAGSPPRAIVETLPKGRLLASIPSLPRALAAPGYLLKGVALIAKVRAARVPISKGATDLAVEGEGEARALSFTSRGERKRIETATVALHQGVVPNQQITRLLGCAHRWSERQQCFHPVLDADGATSVEWLHVAGDSGGVGGARSAALSGRRLGLRIAARMGGRESGELATLDRDIARDLAVRPFLDALYAPSAQALAPSDDTLVCRCEEITAGAIREATRLGAPGPNQVKSFLRAGMGPCQGRVCGLVVSAVIAAERGLPLDEIGYFRIRPPLKPLQLSELANFAPADALQGVP
jgi:NADPH-dependent 2,4-dienoyl-CoA reductase/sulfur reductase-like enzyme